MKLPALPWYGYAVVAAGTVLLFSKKGSAGSAIVTDPIGALPTKPMHTIKLGSKGEEVSIWQGIIGVTVTGTFDQATKTATIAYQKSHGLEADGVVGKNTWASAGYSWTGTLGGSGDSGQPGPTMPSEPIGTGADDNHFGLSNNIAERENQILSYIAQGKVDVAWEPVLVSGNGHNGVVFVSRRPLALLDGSNRLTFSVTPPTAQKIADLLQGYWLTTKVSDAAYKQADTKLPVMSRPISSSTAVMLDQNRKIESALEKAGYGGGLTANEGKDWVLTRRNYLPPLGTGQDTGGPNYNPFTDDDGESDYRNGANFGWYPGGSKSPGGASVIQSVGLAHNMGHVDYSQLVRLMRQEMTVDGKTMSVSQVLADPEYSALLNDEGGIIPLPYHPMLV